MTYALIRPILHAMEPERAHHAALWVLSHGLLPARRWRDDPMLATTLWGRTFANPIGLAAGFDKNAEAITALCRAGFGFVEVGTVTLNAQEGNPAPRMFRLPEDGAVVNRLGFNNTGADIALKNIAAARAQNPHLPHALGVNIGKNKDCENTLADYTTLYEAFHGVADYITINVSSPNTQGLRDLQQKRQLEELLHALLKKRRECSAAGGAAPPMLVKIAPDIDAVRKEDIAELALTLPLDGLILTNTTIKRPNTLKNLNRSEQGGLSGKPLMDISTRLLADMYQLTQGKVPLIGVGGIASAEDAYQKIRAGASLIQLYTALTYQGFGLVREIHDGLVVRLKRDGFSHLSEAVGSGHKEGI